MPDVACFTSFTYAYLSRARVLAASVRRLHPDWSLHALITDQPPPGFEPASLDGFDQVMDAADLAIPGFGPWLFKHDVVEACTAVKGAMLLHLLVAGAQKVIYLDPDIAVFAPLDGLLARLDSASIVLTPHQITANDTPEAIADNELGSMRHGIYNLGFLGVRRDATGLGFARWWAERLGEACYDAPEQGLFTDQKYCDLVPGLFGAVHIERDPGCNVASWNVNQRRLAINRKGELTAGGRLLRFYHFTKIGADGSSHVGDAMTERAAGDNLTVHELIAWYKRALLHAAVPGLDGHAWHFSRFSDGTAIPRTARLLWRARADLRARFADPFAAEGGFLDWLRREQPGILGIDEAPESRYPFRAALGHAANPPPCDPSPACLPYVPPPPAILRRHHATPPPSFRSNRMARRFLITGGAGYVGSHLVAALLAQGAACTVLDDLSTGHAAAVLPDARLLRLRLEDGAAVDAVLADGPWHAVFHFAALSLVGDSMRDPIGYLAANVGNGLRLIDSCVRHGVPRFVLSSTAALFGTPESMPIDEAAAINPASPYGDSKWMLERALGWAERVHGLRYAALRYFNAAGADPAGRLGEDHTPETHLVPLAIDAMLGRRGELAVFGRDYATPDGTCIRDYVHVSDLADAHLLALAQLDTRSVTYNVGTSHGHSVLEVIRSVERVSGRRVPYRMAERRPGDPPALVASPALLIRETGWAPRHAALDDIVATALRWREAHPRGYRHAGLATAGVPGAAEKTGAMAGAA